MLYKSRIGKILCLATTSCAVMVHAEQVSGTVQDPQPFKLSYSVISSDLQYTASNAAYSLQPVNLICLDVETDIPEGGSLVSFHSNGAFHSLRKGGGPLGEAAIHWIIDNYYAKYHIPDSNPKEYAFQYALWEIGNDFDGTVGSISDTAGRINPSQSTLYFPGKVGYLDFYDAYKDMYDGLIAALPSLSINYRSTTYTIDLLINDDPTQQNMVAIELRPPLSLTNAPQAAVVGNSYTAGPTVSGGSVPFIWTAAQLPPGISLNSTTGELNGTPATGSEGSYSIVVTDSSTPKKTQTMTLVIGPPLTVTAPPSAIPGQPYGSAIVNVIGGVQPYTWSSPKLPAGITLDPATGILTGTPAPGSDGSYSITVTDGAGKTQTVFFQVFSPAVIPALSDWGKLLLGICMACLAFMNRQRFMMKLPRAK